MSIKRAVDLELRDACWVQDTKEQVKLTQKQMKEEKQRMGCDDRNRDPRDEIVGFEDRARGPSQRIWAAS